ncbi:unnamed protein product [Soboliphyme baturini]|uniref:Chondroitin sulfate synthase 1 n=1 Tax=Soboliphyme baturini TaxID=241478 RepID=A0A183IPD6_9BILA|nr:unnamed protein product [Soboliphyme baturini]
MTAQKFVDSRAAAIYDTWGSQMRAHIRFFVGENTTTSTRRDLPLVRMRGVDDRYPPQKKSFLMLKYMYENLINDYEWFMRADDDLYVKPNKIKAFLRSLNSSERLYIGQAGLGIAKEFGMLGFAEGDNFCMGGTGMIFSRETLKRFAPHVAECLRNLYTTHEDVEVGRCVRKFAQVACTWNYEVRSTRL